MADQVLTLVYTTNSGLVTHSGITGNAMPAVCARVLSTKGIIFEPGAYEGRTLRDLGDAGNRAEIITYFNSKFDKDPNPYHDTDNLTLIISSA